MCWAKGKLALLLTAPLQLLTSVFGFLARDPVAGTGMGGPRRDVGALRDM
jgi:hypothetical protein